MSEPKNYYECARYLEDKMNYSYDVFEHSWQNPYKTGIPDAWPNIIYPETIVKVVNELLEANEPTPTL